LKPKQPEFHQQIRVESVLVKVYDWVVAGGFMFWGNRSKDNGEAIVTSDGRTVANGNVAFETPEVKALLEAIREASVGVRNPPRQLRRPRINRKGRRARIIASTL
jgi:hypothetical protein